MEYRQIKAHHVMVRLDRGEEVISALTELCKNHGIEAGHLSAIGAVRDAELGYYDLASFSYQTRKLPEIYELVSFLGNVALVDGEPFVHAHATLGSPDLSLLGGHLMSATVAVTLEVVLTVFDTRFERALDPEVKLKLLKL